MRQYADFDIGFVDAAVFAVVERLGEPKPATLDRRNFGGMKPRHVLCLQLLPALLRFAKQVSSAFSRILGLPHLTFALMIGMVAVWLRPGKQRLMSPVSRLAK